MAVQVYGHDIKLTPEIKEHIQRELESLRKFIDHKVWQRSKIEVGLTSRHHQKGRIHRAEINLPLPGKFLRAEEEAEDLHTAINIVKEEIERQVKKYLGKKDVWRG